MAKINAELYQWIYDHNLKYGRADCNHCPGIRSWVYYKNWLLKKPIMDLGSGTGETIEFFREHKYEAYGIDYIKAKNKFCKQGDITLSMDIKKYGTVTCFDVFEHLNNAQVKGVLQNMVQCQRQIFTIANTPSFEMVKGEKVDLHVNKKPFPVWRGIIQDYFDIYQEFEIRPYQHLYLCERKQGDQTLIDYLGNKGYIITKEDEKWQKS